MKGFRSSAFRAVVALFMTAGAPVALATTGTATGTIQRIYTYGDGSVLVTGFYFAGATCTNNSAFYIQGTHPQFARLMAVILAAKTSGATLADLRIPAAVGLRRSAPTAAPISQSNRSSPSIP